jgi:hypothetical protein
MTSPVWPMHSSVEPDAAPGMNAQAADDHLEFGSVGMHLLQYGRSVE